MARYLSAEWLDAVGRAASASDELRRSTRGVRFTVQQRVTGVPEGDVTYHVVVDDGSVDVRPGEAEQPDVTFIQDHATAVGIGTGTVSAQAAFMLGRLRVAGDLPLLVTHRDAVAGLDTALASVREDTEYPETETT